MAIFRKTTDITSYMRKQATEAGAENTLMSDEVLTILISIDGHTAFKRKR